MVVPSIIECSHQKDEAPFSHTTIERVLSFHRFWLSSRRKLCTRSEDVFGEPSSKHTMKTDLSIVWKRSRFWFRGLRVTARLRNRAHRLRSSALMTLAQHISGGAIVRICSKNRYQFVARDNQSIVQEVVSCRHGHSALLQRSHSLETATSHHVLLLAGDKR